MRIIQKFHIIFFILTLAYYSSASDINFKANGDETQVRLRRHIKKSENISESVNKSKQQEQPDSLAAVTNSQLPRSASYAIDTAADVARTQINMEQPGQNNLPNAPMQARQFNYPFQEYIPIVGNQNYFSGFPTALQPFEQIYSNFGAQQPFWNYYNNLPSYQSFLPAGFGPQQIPQIWQLGLPQIDQISQQNFPPAFANNFFNYFPQLGAPQSYRSNDEQLGNPIIPHGNPHTDSNHFVGSPLLPNPHNLLQTSQASQQLRLNPPVEMLHVGAPPQINEVSVPANFVPDFIRNQRSAEGNNEI